MLNLLEQSIFENSEHIEELARIIQDPPYYIGIGMIRCPLTETILENPVIAPCGDTFSSENIEALTQETVCPCCGKTLPPDKNVYVHNKTIVSIINKLRENNDDLDTTDTFSVSLSVTLDLLKETMNPEYAEKNLLVSALNRSFLTTFDWFTSLLCQQFEKNQNKLIKKLINQKIKLENVIESMNRRDRNGHTLLSLADKNNWINIKDIILKQACERMFDLTSQLQELTAENNQEKDNQTENNPTENNASKKIDHQVIEETNNNLSNISNEIIELFLIIYFYQYDHMRLFSVLERFRKDNNTFQLIADQILKHIGKSLIRANRQAENQYFFYLLNHAHPESVDMFVVDDNDSPTDSQSFLHWSINYRNEVVAEGLLRRGRGADIKAVTQKEQLTPMQLAIKRGFFDNFIDMLIRAYRSDFQGEAHFNLALFKLIESNRSDPATLFRIEYLLSWKGGARLDYCDIRDGLYPLHWALLNNNEKVYKLLLRMINRRGESKSEIELNRQLTQAYPTPSVIAIQNNLIKVIKEYKKYCNFSAITYQGMTTLQVAIQEKRYEIISEILDNPQNVVIPYQRMVTTTFEALLFILENVKDNEIKNNIISKAIVSLIKNSAESKEESERLLLLAYQQYPKVVWQILYSTMQDLKYESDNFLNTRETEAPKVSAIYLPTLVAFFMAMVEEKIKDNENEFGSDPKIATFIEIIYKNYPDFLVTIDGRSLLHVAAQYSHVPLIEWCLTLGGDITRQVTNQGISYTPIELAAKSILEDNQQNEQVTKNLYEAMLAFSDVPDTNGKGRYGDTLTKVIINGKATHNLVIGFLANDFGAEVFSKENLYDSLSYFMQQAGAENDRIIYTILSYLNIFNKLAWLGDLLTQALTMRPMRKDIIEKFLSCPDINPNLMLTVNGQSIPLFFLVLQQNPDRRLLTAFLDHPTFSLTECHNSKIIFSEIINYININSDFDDLDRNVIFTGIIEKMIASSSSDQTLLFCNLMHFIHIVGHSFYHNWYDKSKIESKLLECFLSFTVKDINELQTCFSGFLIDFVKGNFNYLKLPLLNENNKSVLQVAAELKKSIFLTLILNELVIKKEMTDYEYGLLLVCLLAKTEHTEIDVAIIKDIIPQALLYIEHLQERSYAQHYAAAKGDLDILALFLQHKYFDLNKTNSHANATMLFVAASAGHWEVVVELLKLPTIIVDAQCNADDNSKKTAEEIAQTHQHLKIASLLGIYREINAVEGNIEKLNARTFIPVLACDNEMKNVLNCLSDDILPPLFTSKKIANQQYLIWKLLVGLLNDYKNNLIFQKLYFYSFFISDIDSLEPEQNLNQENKKEENKNEVTKNQESDIDINIKMKLIALKNFFGMVCQLVKESKLKVSEGQKILDFAWDVFKTYIIWECTPSPSDLNAIKNNNSNHSFTTFTNKQTLKTPEKEKNKEKEIADWQKKYAILSHASNLGVFNLYPQDPNKIKNALQTFKYKSTQEKLSEVLQFAYEKLSLAKCGPFERGFKIVGRFFNTE